jgi:uncharacterized protein YaaN involved in tellurite resistance
MVKAQDAMTGSATNAALRRQAEASKQATEITTAKSQMPPIVETLSLTSANMGVNVCMTLEVA